MTIEDRIYLKFENEDDNHATWMHEVRVQTGNSFGLKGSALCAAEEILEYLTADGREEVADAIGDTWVATSTVGCTVINEILGANPDWLCGGPYVGHEITTADLLKAAMRFVNIGRKGVGNVRSETDLQGLLQLCADIRVTMRELADQKFPGGWHSVIDPVWDILDRRLQEGYHMSAEGSAIKMSDA